MVTVIVMSALKSLHHRALSFCNYIHINDCMQSTHLETVLLSELNIAIKCSHLSFHM